MPATAPPVTTVADDGPTVTVATSVLLLVHVPPAIGSLNVIVAPEHTVLSPDIAPGEGLTVIVIVGDPQPLE